jgi:hypothetical protein
MNVTGYRFNVHVSTNLNESPFNLNKRTPINDDRLLSTNDVYASLSKTTLTAASGGLVSNEIYTIQFEIKRTGSDSVDLTASYYDNNNSLLAAVTASDSENAYFTFDSMIYRPANLTNKGGVHNITGFSVEVIPEPSTYALFAGIGGVALVMLRRRMIR